jgi:threonine-phosphate decarboxylase
MTRLAPLHGGQLRQIADHFGIPISELLDFSANINPEGPPAAVLSALRASLNEPSILTNYPDLDEKELRQSLARYAGIRPESVVVANGFVPLLDAALRILPIRSCLVPVPAFVEYRKVLERSGAEFVSHGVDSGSGFNYEVSNLVTGSHDAILLANPQNPSGVLCRRETMLRIAEEAARRNVVVLLDEAFIDYCPEATLSREIDRFPNLVVFRSVTKFFAMAGLRVAYALAHEQLRKRIQEVVAPWPVTSLASLAAGHAVQDDSYVRRTITRNNERRDQMRRAMEKLGIDVYSPAANFLLLRLPGHIDCHQLWERLIRRHRIVLRNCANYEALDSRHLRAAVRDHMENERLIEALAHEMEEEQ